ncbi:SGNH/GDSL hydrolase family protein [Streptomyces sp. TRM 70351]|uniref:SGNH/GDSL hydrolase family protein n=1 Tax=Streptomyces sp. TRM 70351 TaxID=3116552 RepID=UPI002E7BC9E5|nr:SGNH/GDSL hydrolase family protein [Streptomyces sp. TRM 70351]MEE1927842.1 SGNH/GDSL hydrolase family protein [Streptomyces sp. TRM 70351]
MRAWLCVLLVGATVAVGYGWIPDGTLPLPGATADARTDGAGTDGAEAGDAGTDGAGAGEAETDGARADGPAVARGERPRPEPEPPRQEPLAEQVKEADGSPAPKDARPVRDAGSAEPAARDRRPARVLYLGDSLAVETRDEVGRRVRHLDGTAYRGEPYPGTLPCDYLEDRGARSPVPERHKAAALVRSFRPTVVVLQFWGRPAGRTPCADGVEAGTPAYYARYTADTEALTGQIASAARRAGLAAPAVMWVLQGPDATAPDRVRRVNGIYQTLAPRTGDLLADAGRAVSRPGARYTWTRHLPCNQEERADGHCEDGRATLHRADDPLHFCLAPAADTPRPCPRPSPGVSRYAAAITAAVSTALAAHAAS